jgi:CBS domain-containing protein
MSNRVQDFIGKASGVPVTLKVRDLLAVWGYKARNYESVALIQRELAAAGLQCEPDLAQGSSDSFVTVGLLLAAAPNHDFRHEAEESRVASDEPLQLPPVALLVKHIPSAMRGVEQVRPQDTLEKAQALMSAHDYSQLAVMSGPRDLKGVVSWQSVAKAGLSKSQVTLRDATMMLPTVVHVNDDLLGKIDALYHDGFVFVKDEDDRICGIVTTADLTVQFRDLTKPFFQLGEIEGRLRRCIDRHFDAQELRVATGNKKLDSAEDMTFWEYMRLLDDEVRWKRMGWKVDCATFVDFLNDTRIIRNKVMHFGEDLTSAQKSKLSQCLNFMKALDPLP